MVEIQGAGRPFWMHQIVEYLIGMVLIAAAFQSPEPTVQAVMGLVIIVNAAIARGAAGAFNLVGHKLHRVLDVVIMVLLVVAALQGWVDVDSTGRIVLPAMAFVMFFIWLNTDFTDKATRRAGRSSKERASSEEVGRKAGRMVGDGMNAARRWQKKD
jgi:uncharacterized membrane protein YkvI